MDLIKLFRSPSANSPAPLITTLQAKASAANRGSSAFSFLYGSWVMLPESYTTYIDKGFKSIPYVYGIVDQIAEKFSDAPRELMEITDMKKSRGYDALIKSARSPKDFFMAKMLKLKAMRTLDGDHPFYAMMQKPNPITPTEKTFNYSRCGYLALTGNNYSFSRTLGMGPTPNAPKEWWIIPSPTCAPIVGTLFDPIKGYHVTYFEEDIPPHLIQHVKLSNFTSSAYNIQETLIGMSPMQPLCSTNSQIHDADNANGTALANLSPAGVLSGDGGPDTLSEEQGEQIQSGFIQRHTGRESWKKIIVTPAKTTWTKIGFSPVELEILKFMDKAEERIAKVYHYPLGLLNSQGEVANETINSRRMITDAVLPYIRRFDDADTESVKVWYNNPRLKVVTDLQYYPELQEDMTRIATWLKDAYWLTLEEKRGVMDYEEKWAGTMLVPSNFETLENILASRDLSGGDDLTL